MEIIINSSNWLVYVKETQSIFYAVETEFLNII
jgi:hypothetical protein